MNHWKITGLIATLVICLSLPAYMLKEKYWRRPPVPAPVPVATFAGSKKCMDCHKAEYDKWGKSHHDHAMDVASDDTVRADFNDAMVEFNAVTSRFYRKGQKFIVHTQGPDGKMGEFEITHTFGWYPLQQYLVPFPGGRLQCLPIAWDVKEKKWYHLYADGPIAPDDWLYWTNAGQNWNGMCAECHSTNLKKNYDINSDAYQTSWSEIDVGCEACHGPGSRHVEWAELPDMARPQTADFELVVKTNGHGFARSGGVVRPLPLPAGDSGRLHPRRSGPAGQYAAEPPDPGPVFCRRPDTGRSVCLRLLHAEQDVQPRRALQRLPRCAQHQKG